MTLRIAHISDLHFAKPDWSLSQFFSKRWVGNLNSVISGNRSFIEDRPQTLIKKFLDLGVTHVVISGDVSITSARKEFAMARAYVEQLKEAGLETIVIPGNHDNYTRISHKNKEFYRYFDRPELRRDGVSAQRLSNGWWTVSVDTTLPTPIYKSTGLFTPQIARNLTATLDAIPKEDRVIVINHFPLFANDAPLRSLEGAKDMRKVLENYPNIQLYLHGHTHRHCVADLRKNGLPIILDSGSVTLKDCSTWNLIDLEDEGCQVRVFAWDEHADVWKRKKDFSFPW
jgi:3',5'-cyclic AMP phosphodiesterase CpdA